MEVKLSSHVLRCLPAAHEICYHLPYSMGSPPREFAGSKGRAKSVGSPPREFAWFKNSAPMPWAACPANPHGLSRNRVQMPWAARSANSQNRAKSMGSPPSEFAWSRNRAQMPWAARPANSHDLKTVRRCPGQPAQRIRTV